jgi:glycine/D-amino acid oxidase-like deaminating enzyme
VQPAHLARGLARRVEGLGATIYERTPAVGIEPGAVQTPAGSVAARSVILATEAYTAELPGHERDVVPIYDFMIATAPLPAAAWDEIGWAGREVLSDGRYMIVYAQRTADGRVAIGGTTAPYYYGSRIDERLERSAAIYERVQRALRLLLPAAGEVEVTHRWGGVLGATRDWHTTAEYDPRSGLGFAGGYVGDGVATANLAGRTLRDLILGIDGELVRLPWVGHRSRRWEPEPLRWLAASGVNLLLSHADRVEFGTGRTVTWQPVLEKVQKTVGW